MNEIPKEFMASCHRLPTLFQAFTRSTQASRVNRIGEGK